MRKHVCLIILLVGIFTGTMLYGSCKNISGNWFLYIYGIYDDTCDNNLLGFEKFLNGTGALITVEQNQCTVSIKPYFTSNIPAQNGTMDNDKLATDFNINLDSVGLKYVVNTDLTFTDYLGEGTANYTAQTDYVTCTFKSHLKFVKVTVTKDSSGGDTSAVKFSQDIINSLDSGWSLAGTSVSITDMSIFDNVKTVWAWNGNSWMIYSPLQSIQNIISSYSISPLTEISANSGFWINK